MGFCSRKLLTFAATVILAPWPAFAGSVCDDLTVDLRGPWGQARFQVEVADDPEERAQGLMFRESMAANSGMLFVYPSPQRAAFWMKNTLIPLDMIFADENGVVTRVHENAIPQDLTPIEGGEGIRFVLEINGGLSGRYRIDEGSELRHPLVDGDDAAWPCETGN